MGVVLAVGGVTGVVGGVDSLDEDGVNSVNTGSASDSARGGGDLEEVLLSLDGGSGEGNLEDEGISICVEVAGDGAVVDDLVGEVAEGVLDVGGEGPDVSGLHLNGDGGEGLVHLGGESKSEGLAVEVSGGVSGGGLSAIGTSGDEGDGLDLGVGGDTSVGAKVHDVVSGSAHPGSAVDSGPPSVTDAGTGAVGIPGSIGGGDGGSVSEATESVGGPVIIISPDGSKGELVLELAGSVPGAVVGAALAAASLALESAEALTLASLTVADSLAGALGVKVGEPSLVGGSGPGELVGAEPGRGNGRGRGRKGSAR